MLGGLIMTDKIRLYAQFQPEHYDLYLDINRETKMIHGQTTVRGWAVASTIKLHQKYLTIQNVTAAYQNLTFSVNEQQETVTIELPQAGTTEVTLDYEAPLTDSMMGIYPSYYQVAGQTKQLIGTQFETTAARQAFPCVDEPAAKATFSLAIKFDEHPGETIISNMPEKQVQQGVHYFETTVKMSTYLVAFAFGELQSVTTTTKSGVQVGIFATQAHSAQELTFALDIAKRSIEFYEDYYQTPYPLPHSWHLALPDFSAGAMENWGLITYRETCLLIDPQNAALENQQYVATVIAHELAHQWFGDLVTMQWWDDLWLNESFANMMEYVAINALQPDWHIWELFQTAEVPAALKRDATAGVQPVHVQVEHPAEIDAIFDSAIVYAKGARMLVMVRALIGDQALRQGLKAYFAKHQYANATGNDLWQSLGNAAHMDLKKIMDTWLEQPGYPVVSVKLQADTLILHQQQFFIGESQDQHQQWQIPLKSNFKALPQLMTTSTVEIPHYRELRQAAQQPLQLNVENESHFIVAYDDQLLADLVQNVSELDAVTQLQILQDAALLAEGQQKPYAAVIQILPQFSHSTSNIVNAEFYQILHQLQKFVQPQTAAETALKQVYRQFSADEIKRLGWLPQEQESLDDQLSRPIFLQAGLYGEDPALIQQGHQLFTEYQADLASFPAATRASLLVNEVQNYGNAALFEQLMTLYRKTSVSDLKTDIAVAMPKIADQSLLRQMITLFEDSQTIKPQDLRSWYRGVLLNPKGQQLAWDWLRTDWSWLEQSLGGDMEFTAFITVTANAFHTPERLAEFRQFFEPKVDVPGLGREIIMDAKAIAGRVALVQEQQQLVQTAIKRLVSAAV